MEAISLAVAGFSAVVAALFLLTYIVFIDVPNKSISSVASCALLLAALATLQVSHLRYFAGAEPPLQLGYYRVALFVTPVSFYFFGRWAVLPNEPFRPLLLLHLLPVALLFLVPLEIALPTLFLSGVGYSAWLGNLVYTLRGQRKQIRFELFYLTVMFLLAVTVLILGFSLPHIDNDYFYYFYCHAIGGAFAIMVVALIAYPELIADLTEAARIRYGTSTLKGVDVDTLLRRLEQTMDDASVYQDENLNLSALAAKLGLSGHQLSELVNTRLGMGFSRYVRERRITAAKRLLISAPSQSILSISMDTGFKSQSSFYAAFKEVTGQSPGDYRKAHHR
jgi:AraC-like DNA-binding protein